MTGWVTARLKQFWRNEDAAAAIEYVVLLLPLMALVFTSLQIVLAYHFALTAQKAADLGARIAAVRDPVFNSLPETNDLDITSGLARGDSCALGACTDPGGPWICSGATVASDPNCDLDSYLAIRNEVARIAYLLDDDDVAISYQYGFLGHAGGDFVPLVTVSIQERPFFLQFFFNLSRGGLATDQDDDAIEVELPVVASTAIAEDLSSTN